MSKRSKMSNVTIVNCQMTTVIHVGNVKCKVLDVENIKMSNVKYQNMSNMLKPVKCQINHVECQM